MWVGATLKPLKKFENNFQVVSTDYDNYAILYTCTHKTSMYNRDSITIMVREAPGVEEPSEELINTIKDEFNKIFGGEEGSKTEEAGAEEKEDKDEKEKEAGEEDEDEEKEGKDAGAEDKEDEAEQ